MIWNKIKRMEWVIYGFLMISLILTTVFYEKLGPFAVLISYLIGVGVVKSR